MAALFTHLSILIYPRKKSRHLLFFNPVLFSTFDGRKYATYAKQTYLLGICMIRVVELDRRDHCLRPFSLILFSPVSFWLIKVLQSAWN